MKKVMYRMVTGLLALLFVGSGVLCVRQLAGYRAGEQSYDTAREMAQSAAAQETVELPEESVPLESTPPQSGPNGSQTQQKPLAEEAQFLMELDLMALRQVNEDVLGWIFVPGSVIDYPLMEAETNSEYLDKAWDGTSSQAGAIFLECRNSRDFSDFNTLIYGHNMRNDAMFGSLHDYKDPDYWDSHSDIYLVTDAGVRRYQVFSAYEAPVTSDTYRLYFENDARRQSALEHYVGSSVIESGLVPAEDDLILTLSTCTGSGNYDRRWVVQAVLTGVFCADA